MKQSIWAFHKETIGIVKKGLKNNFLSYFILLAISLVAIGTVVLAPFGIKFLVGMHEMLIVDGKIDYKKLFEQVDDTSSYFATLLVLLAEAVIIVGGFALFVVPGIILSLALIPVNYFLYKGMTPKMSVVIPTAMETMKGKKTQLFLVLLIASIVYGLLYAVLTIGAFFLGNIYFMLAWPFYLILIAVTLLAAIYFLVLIVLFTRKALEKPEQPTVSA
ncbi:MAG TPA: hypothetical protein P5154_06405 [Candidatus Izemoplasmatales bacterium]|nr:hypothetical protein [Bacillota bacterium]HRY78376.1 hypothetical protein [Candidatus Izemoplasmatales bacterium]